jgi:DNA-binding NtrC family response regulator
MGRRVLVADDDRSIRRTFEKLLIKDGYDVVTAASGEEALAVCREAPGVDAVLLDLGMPGMDGLEVLGALRELGRPAPPVIVVTAREDMESTVRAVQLGAYDYLVKPVDVERVRAFVEKAVGSHELSREQRGVALPEGDGATAMGPLVGRSAAMREVFKAIGALSTGRASVLLRGESGTGKEVVAKAIHQNSAERDLPFVAVNCTAFPHDILESELFGHVRGSFTGAVADRVGRFEAVGAGTLFLDEIAEIPVDLQAKLLRVLQERTFERVGDNRVLPLRARIIAATHRDLDEAVGLGTFRKDLLYRLRVVEVRLPPLRERRDDIPVLVEALLPRICRELHKTIRYVAPDALLALRAYDWPGNVRELENALTRAAVLAKTDVLEAGLLPIPSGERAEARSQGAAPAEGELLSLAEVERRHIERILRATGWNKRRTCAVLQISRPTLDRKIAEYALAPDQA